MLRLFPKLCLIASLAFIPSAHAGFFSDIMDSISSPSEPISEDEKAHPQAYEYYKNGIKKHDAKEYQGAIEEFNRAIDAYPAFAQAYKRRGNTKGWLNDDQGWKEDTTRAIALEPTNALYYADRAKAKFYLKDYVGKITDYEKAVALDPNNQSYKEKLNAAKRSLRWDMVVSAEEKNNPQAYALFQSGIVKADAKEFQGAIEDLTSAINADPKFSPAYKRRGLAKGWLSDNQGWLNDINTAIGLESNIAYYYDDRALVKSYMQDYLGSITDWEKAVALDPNNEDYLTKRDNAKAKLPAVLYEAVKRGDVTQVEKILSAHIGFDANSEYISDTLLGHASENGQMAMVKFLVSKGARINGYGHGINTPLHNAAMHGDQAMAAYLLSHGADINGQNFAGYTPLHLVTLREGEQYRNLEKFLIAKGANTTLKSKDGFTAYQWDQANQQEERQKQRAQAQEERDRAERQALQEAQEKARFAVIEAENARIRAENAALHTSSSGGYWQMNADAAKRDLENMQQADAARRNAEYKNSEFRRK